VRKQAHRLSVSELQPDSALHESKVVEGGIGMIVPRMPHRPGNGEKMDLLIPET